MYVRVGVERNGESLRVMGGRVDGRGAYTNNAGGVQNKLITVCFNACTC